MEANLCLPTRHFPAMRHHKTVVVHSSVRVPALQAKVGPPPGAARVAVVGAGVVLACALGTMCWKRACALQFPMYRSSQTSHVGGIVQIKELHDLLSEICIRKLDPKPPQLTKLIHECLAQKDVNPYLMTSLLEEKFHQTKSRGEHEYNLGIVLILALISEKEYVKAKEICNQLPIQSDLDSTPHLLLATINMMMAMESMLQFPNETSTIDLKKNLEERTVAFKKNLEEVGKAWEKYERNAPLQAGPPQTTK